MYDRVEKIYQRKDKLSREVFRFILFDGFKLILDHYSTQSRPTTRHKYQVQDSYTRLMRRESNLDPKDVPVADFIIQEVKKEILERLTFQLEQ